MIAIPLSFCFALVLLVITIRKTLIDDESDNFCVRNTTVINFVDITKSKISSPNDTYVISIKIYEC